MKYYNKKIARIYKYLNVILRVFSSRECVNDHKDKKVKVKSQSNPSIEWIPSIMASIIQV